MPRSEGSGSSFVSQPIAPHWRVGRGVLTFPGQDRFSPTRHYFVPQGEAHAAKDPETQSPTA